MQIGDTVTWNNRDWIVRGFTPMGIAARQILLECEPGEQAIWVLLDEVSGGGDDADGF